MGVRCLTEIIFAIACTMHGEDPAAQRMLMGDAVVVADVGSFHYIPSVGPVIAWRVELPKKTVTRDRKEEKASVIMTSFLPVEKKMPEVFRKFKGGFWALKDGNEEVGCIVKNKRLMALMSRVHQHYGKKLIIESGFRSRKYNASVSGAKNSAHMRCNAVDFEIAGVSKQALAKYLRSMSGVGGVGTYCKSNPVHMDIERRRDWNWPCNRRAKKPLPKWRRK